MVDICLFIYLFIYANKKCTIDIVHGDDYNPSEVHFLENAPAMTLTLGRKYIVKRAHVYVAGLAKMITFTYCNANSI
jgi:poly(3-hydroxybutyrate) depolymerase